MVIRLTIVAVKCVFKINIDLKAFCFPSIVQNDHEWNSTDMKLNHRLLNDTLAYN